VAMPSRSLDGVMMMHLVLTTGPAPTLGEPAGEKTMDSSELREETVALTNKSHGAHLISQSDYRILRQLDYESIIL